MMSPRPITRDDRDPIELPSVYETHCSWIYFSPQVVARLNHLQLLPEVFLRGIHFLQNVKEHATVSAGAKVDHGVRVETTGNHVNRAADRGCVSRLVLRSFLTSRRDLDTSQSNPHREATLRQRNLPDGSRARLLQLCRARLRLSTAPVCRCHIRTGSSN
jgi:hypothetical protein